MIDQFLSIDWNPLLISFKLSFFTTSVLLFFSIPFAWYLSQSNSSFKPLLEAVTALPIVLPPSVLGFYLLILFSDLKDIFDVELLFNFWGLVIASIIYSLPFMVQPLQSGFEGLNKRVIEASYIAGKSSWITLWRVALPNIKPSLITAVIITFAHTLGEFGVVLMVGGSIPNETKVASVAIYEMVEIMDYSTAHIYSGIMVALSFITLIAVFIFNRYKKIV